MKLEQREKKKLKIVLRCLYLVLILLPLLVVATYTWFSISTTPKVSEMGLTISSGTGMELAFTADSEEWGQHLDFRETIEETAELKPITWSEQQNSFFAAEFGADGRISGITERLSDEANTNRTGSNGYYMKYICYAKTQEPVKVSLAPAVVTGEETQGAGTYLIGTPVWNSDTVSHDNGGHGAEYAIRVGFFITKYDKTTGERINTSVLYIYEPNCDNHIDGTNNVINTESIDGTGTLVSADRLIQQTTTSWNETYPIQHDVVIRSPGTFLDDTSLFNLRPEEMAKIEIYVWLEGQDVDCTNEIGVEAQIFANIQFNAEVDTDTGLEVIE